MRLFGWAALAAAVALAHPASAQLADPEAVIVEELVVQAVEPGPAWWRVSDGDSTVYILGVGEDQVPADLAWDRSYLHRRLEGADRLIIGSQVSLSGGMRDIPALLKARRALRSDAPLEAGLPEPLRARFVAARERLGKPARRYAGWTPLVAGERLLADSRGQGPSQSVTAAAVSRAKAKKVKVVNPAEYDAMPFIRRALAGLTPEIHHKCLASALDDVETEPAKVRAAVEGWARGDVAAALSEPRGFEKCVLLLGGGAELWRKARDDRAAAIVQALETPGHSVAVVGLRQLLAADGVIAALEARGLNVLGPGEPG